MKYGEICSSVSHGWGWNSMSVWEVTAGAPVNPDRPFDNRLRHIVSFVKKAGGTADALSYARIGLSALFVICLYRAPWLTPIIAFIDGVTDLIDGPFARKHGSSDKGWFIDPVCDKESSGVNMIALAFLVQLDFDIEVGGVSVFFTIAILMMLANFTNEYNRILLIRQFGWKKAGEIAKAGNSGKIKVWFISLGNALLAVAYTASQTDTDPLLVVISASIAGIGIAAAIPPLRYRWAAWIGIAILFSSSFIPLRYNAGLVLGQVGLLGFMFLSVVSIRTQLRNRRRAAR